VGHERPRRGPVAVGRRGFRARNLHLHLVHGE
jgi:hypothetical protein